MRDIVWLLFLGAALTGGLLYHAFAVSLAATAGFLLAASASVWRRYGLARVRYSSTLDRNRVAFGETVELRTDISNDKILPLAWITIGQGVPSRLDIRGATLSPSPEPLIHTMVNALALLPYERVVRRFEIRCEHRGHFEFQAANLESGDPFGLVRTTANDGATSTLIVYPKLRKLLNLPASAQGLIGDARVRRWFPHDPLAVVGARPYAAGDSAHAIDWRVTARMRTLHVRELESTANPQLAIFLDATPCPALECAISFAASFVVESVEQGWAAGLYAAPARAVQLRVAIPPSRGPNAATLALERLAALTPDGDETFTQLLGVETKRLPFGVTPCAVVVDPGEDEISALATLSERRTTIVFVVDVDDSAARLAAKLPRANVIRVPFETDWMQRDAVTLGV